MWPPLRAASSSLSAISSQLSAESFDLRASSQTCCHSEPAFFVGEESVVWFQSPGNSATTVFRRMFWLNYGAKAPAGFHTCVVRSRSNPRLHHRRKCRLLLRERSRPFFGFLVRREASVSAEARLPARRRNVNQQCHLLQFPAIRDGPICVIGACGDLELNRTKSGIVETTKHGLFTFAKSSLDMRVAASLAQRLSVLRRRLGKLPCGVVVVSVNQPGNQRQRYRCSIHLSYTEANSVTGLEPATSRLIGEVTLVFTTGRTRIQTPLAQLAGEPARRDSTRGRSLRQP